MPPLQDVVSEHDECLTTSGSTNYGDDGDEQFIIFVPQGSTNFRAESVMSGASLALV